MTAWLRLHRLALGDAARRMAAQPLASGLAVAVIALAVALPLRIAGAGADEAGRRVRAALDKVGLLGKEKAMPITLSGGEQQRLCIARAIVNRPAILVADEPTGNLDAASSRAILDLFLSFNGVGVTVLLSTHDESSLAQLGGRRLAISDGAVAA